MVGTGAAPAPGSVPLGSARLGREFFARPTVDVARALLGRVLVVDPGGPEEIRAVLVEVEAYLGTADEASHAARGPTPRSGIMFGPPGHLYVYLSYGVHHCANIVTEVDGTAGAVLLRAAAVTAGETMVRTRREGPVPMPMTRTRLPRRPGELATIPAEALLRGPGNLCRGLGLSREDNGLDLCAPRSRVRLESFPAGEVPIVVGPRVGIRQAVDHPLRFAWRGHPAVSRPEPPTAHSPDGSPG